MIKKISLLVIALAVTSLGIHAGSQADNLSRAQELAKQLKPLQEEFFKISKEINEEGTKEDKARLREIMKSSRPPMPEGGKGPRGGKRPPHPENSDD